MNDNNNYIFQFTRRSAVIYPYNYTLMNSFEKFLVEDNILERNPFKNKYVVISLFKEYQKWKLIDE